MPIPAEINPLPLFLSRTGNLKDLQDPDQYGDRGSCLAPIAGHYVRRQRLPPQEEECQNCSATAALGVRCIRADFVCPETAEEHTYDLALTLCEACHARVRWYRIMDNGRETLDLLGELFDAIEARSDLAEADRALLPETADRLRGIFETIEEQKSPARADLPADRVLSFETIGKLQSIFQTIEECRAAGKPRKYGVELMGGKLPRFASPTGDRSALDRPEYFTGEKATALGPYPAYPAEGDVFQTAYVERPAPELKRKCAHCGGKETLEVRFFRVDMYDKDDVYASETYDLMETLCESCYGPVSWVSFTVDGVDPDEAEEMLHRLIAQRVVRAPEA